ncbi:MAG TPA: DUF3592 domain-containing protein [Salinivirgaceae bacterium]|nr:DUF3592 domain-containing protein [Salinivirgaceae bacterium]HQA76129.1 DUF3592 domain-containing protein [Salinivirgaceae bacterium]
MKTLKIIGGVFSIIGIVSLISAVVSTISTSNFISSSEMTDGVITDVVVRTSEDSDGNVTKSRYPVIQFRDKNGEIIEFESSVSTSSAVKIGKSVKVRYLPDDPEDAIMADTFTDVWWAPMFLGIFGAIFTTIGVLVFWSTIRDSIREKKAMRYTKIVEAKIINVSRNTSVTVNGQHPYVIKAQWLNPDTNELHIFKSKNFWYDPSEFLKSKIEIRMDALNKKKYWMDVSFLPKQV